MALELFFFVRNMRLLAMFESGLNRSRCTAFQLPPFATFRSECGLKTGSLIHYTMGHKVVFQVVPAFTNQDQHYDDPSMILMRLRIVRTRTIQIWPSPL